MKPWYLIWPGWSHVWLSSLSSITTFCAAFQRRCWGSRLACASICVRLIKRSFESWTIFRRFRGFTWSSSSRKRLISRFLRITFIATLSSAITAFRIDNREAGELFFSANNFIISPLRFSVKISEIIGSGVADCFRTTTHREFRGLVTFLGYNPVAFHSDRTFSSRRPISRAFA
jgi:hypothetical protein